MLKISPFVRRNAAPAVLLASSVLFSFQAALKNPAMVRQAPLRPGRTSSSTPA